MHRPLALWPTVPRALRENIRKEDALGRMGGDEFAVMLANATPAATSQLVQHPFTKVVAPQMPRAG